MKRVCIYWLCLMCFTCGTALPNEPVEIRDAMSALYSPSTGPSNQLKVRLLQKQVKELQEEVNALLDKHAQERKAWKRLKNPPLKKTTTTETAQDGWQTITVTEYQTRTRTVWEYCPTCPLNPWQSRTVTEKVPVQVQRQVRVYNPDPQYENPGIYTHKGRKYFWNGKETMWLDSREFFQPDETSSYNTVERPSYSYSPAYRTSSRPIGGYNYQNTGRFVRDDGAPNGPIVAAAKGSILIPIKIIGCLFRVFR